VDGELPARCRAHGPLVLDDMDVAIRAAMDGIGLAISLEECVAPHIASGALVRVLEDWCSPFAGFFLYYPSRRQQPPALSALIDTFPRQQRRRSSACSAGLPKKKKAIGGVKQPRSWSRRQVGASLPRRFVRHTRDPYHPPAFTLDFESRQLTSAGQEIHLEPKAFELLSALVLERPKALSKADLQERLWPGTFVAEANLSNLVAEIRAALGDSARAPTFVRTAHGFGYAFCGDAVPLTGPGNAPPVREPPESSDGIEARADTGSPPPPSSRVPWLVAGVLAVHPAGQWVPSGENLGHQPSLTLATRSVSYGWQASSKPLI
jgi:DNA-binding winged helix-turn-helix (wHTH) protein